MPLEIADRSALEESVEALEAEAQALDAAEIDVFGADFCRAWPFIRKALNTAKLVTPDYVDEVIKVIVNAGEARCSG